MRSAQQYLLGMFRRIAIVTASVLALTAGCTSEPEEPEHEPSGSALVRDASSSLKDLTSVQFDLRTQGALEGFPIRSLQGAATRDGRAFGDVDMQLPTERVQYEFAMGQDRATPPAGARDTEPGTDPNSGTEGTGTGDTGTQDTEDAKDTEVTLTDSEDETTTASLPERFTPGSLLGRDGGLRALLGDATDLSTESREDIDDVPAYRVSARIPQDKMSELLPGVPGDVAAKFWVSDDADRTLLRVWLQVPPRTPNEGAVLIELGLTEHNQPVTTSSAAPTPSDG